MHGLGNADDIRDHISTNDILCINERWSQQKMIAKLMQFDEVICSPAIKTANKGRAKGGLITATNNRNEYKTLFIDENLILIRYEKNTKFITVGLAYCSLDDELSHLLLILHKTLHIIATKYPNDIIVIGSDLIARVHELNQISRDALPE